LKLELAAHAELVDWTAINNEQTQLQKDIAALQAQVSRAEAILLELKKQWTVWKMAHVAVVDKVLITWKHTSST
jgi:hypothetical protein